MPMGDRVTRILAECFAVVFRIPDVLANRLPTHEHRFAVGNLRRSDVGLNADQGSAYVFVRSGSWAILARKGD